MGFFSPQFQFNLRSRLAVTRETSYNAFLNSSNIWWPAAAKYSTTTGGKDIKTWALQTAALELTGQSSDVTFSDMTILEAEYVPEYISKGLELRRAMFEDTDGGGINVLNQWVADISSYAAYLPQKVIADLLINGVTAKGYDNVAFFSATHYYNPKAKGAGSYANLLTGSASGSYPGACPIDTTNAASFDTAFNNLTKVFSYINSIKQANGVDPRFLRPSALVVPSALYPRANALLDAKFGAFAAGSGGGGTVDISGQIQKLGFEKVYLAPELDADPTSYYVIVEQAATSELGAFLWVEREALGTNVYFPNDGANFELAKKDMVAAIARGRAVGGYGHPWLAYKVKAT